MSNGQQDQYFASSHYATVTAGQSPGLLNNPFTPNASIPPTPGSLAGRKRSRGDIFEDDIQPDGSLPTPSEEPPQPAFMGEGMTLSYPSTPAYGNTAESQSSIEQLGAQRPFHLHRPSISSRKSQRLENAPSDSDHLAQLVLPSDMRGVTAEPLIDEATRVLGISWIRMDSSEVLLINQAAYNKFIQNHYPSLKEVTVWFENSAIPAYLVVAVNAHTEVKEYYLFSHDLQEARLITREPSDLLPRLSLLPAIEVAAPAGRLVAENISTSAAQSQTTDLSATVQSDSTMSEAQEMRPVGKHADPAYQYRQMLCTAHEMEMD